MVLGQLVIYMQKNEVGPPRHTIYTKINSDLNVTSKIIKPIEENIGMNLHNLELGNGCLGITAKAEETTTKRY